MPTDSSGQQENGREGVAYSRSARFHPKFPMGFTSFRGLEEAPRCQSELWNKQKHESQRNFNPACTKVYLYIRTNKSIQYLITTNLKCSAMLAIYTTANKMLWEQIWHCTQLQEQSVPWCFLEGEASKCSNHTDMNKHEKTAPEQLTKSRHPRNPDSPKSMCLWSELIPPYLEQESIAVLCSICKWSEVLFRRRHTEIIFLGIQMAGTPRA